MLSDRPVSHAFLLVAATTLLAGCPDPDQAFQDFADRYPKGTSGPVGECGQTVQEVEGKFFFALSVRKPYTQKPIVFLADLVTVDGGLRMTVQPLSAQDRKTPVGTSLELPAPGQPGYAIDEKGAFKADLPELQVEGAANPISGGDIVATISLEGTVCADFLCGEANGAATKPIPLAIDGSTFAMERIEGDDYPEPPQINCQGDLAKPLDQL